MSNKLASLLKKSTLDDDETLLQAAESDLKSSPNDEQAQQTKAIALLKLERYSDALKYFNETTTLQQSLPEAYSYSLYRSGKFEEAVAAASSTQHSRGAQHIILQAAYRAEDWEAAIQAHEALSKSTVAKEDFDLRVNKLAVDAEGLWLEQISKSAVPRAKTDDLSAFETAYNSACISVSKGQLAEADVLLKRAVSLCEHHEELSDDEKVVELVPLKAQRIFVLRRIGKDEEAAALAKEVEASLNSAAVDARTRRIAESNTLSAASHVTNPFVAYKIFNSNSVPKGERFFANQTALLSSNERTLQMQSFKYDGLINAAKKKLNADALPSTSFDLLLTSMFDAAARAQGEVSKAAINKVLPELEKRPNDVGLVMTIVQLYILTGNATAAVDILHAFFVRLEKSATEKDQDVRYSPGLVGLMVSLYRSQNRRSQLKQELAKSATYWRTKSKAPSSLLRSAGIALLESSSPEDVQTASDIFDKLYSQESSDHATIAGYVASHASTTDSDATVKTLAEKLTPISDLISTIDTNALETTGIPQSANALAIAQAGTSRKRKATDSAQLGKPKRTRKSKLPKDYDPNKKPDPERWLPLRDRSTYKPKKKKGKKDDRTQGGGNVNENLDISNRVAGTASEVVTASGGQGGGKNKKKGKGKK